MKIKNLEKECNRFLEKGTLTEREPLRELSRAFSNLHRKRAMRKFSIVFIFIYKFRVASRQRFSSRRSKESE